MFDRNKISVQLSAICDSLSNIKLLTNSKIDEYLLACNIENKGRKTQNVIKNGISGYIPGSSKKEKMYNSLANNINQTQSTAGVIKFLEMVFELTQFAGRLNEFNEARDNINKVLMIIGLEVNISGKVIEVKQAKSLDEVEESVNKLVKEVTIRNLHSEVMKYCSKEYLEKDYFHAGFEAVKGIFERIRTMTSQVVDGAKLLNGVFSTTAPMILLYNSDIINNPTDRDEFLGVKSLIEGLHKSVRNPSAHKPRIISNNNLLDCLEIMTIVSRVHRYLDNCYTTGCCTTLLR